MISFGTRYSHVTAFSSNECKRQRKDFKLQKSTCVKESSRSVFHSQGERNQISPAWLLINGVMTISSSLIYIWLHEALLEKV